MTPSTGNDPLLDDLLLTKADALIRRNRADGVGSDDEELPMLTDSLDDDLPVMTDTLDEMDIPALDAPLAAAVPERVQQAFSLSLDLETEDLTPTGQFQQLSATPPQEIIDKAVGEAVSRLHAEMAAEQERAVREAAARARAEALAEAGIQQQRAVQAALAQGRESPERIQEAAAKARAEALAEARVMQQHAVQAALKQGREEAEINQWPAMQAARQEAVQAAAGAMSERLIELDAQIAQSINQWLAKELPPIIASELLGVSERLRVQTAAHMRATLLPELSDQVAKVLESALKGDSSSQR